MRSLPIDASVGIFESAACSSVDIEAVSQALFILPLASNCSPSLRPQAAAPIITNDNLVLPESRPGGSSGDGARRPQAAPRRWPPHRRAQSRAGMDPRGLRRALRGIGQV